MSLTEGIVELFAWFVSKIVGLFVLSMMLAFIKVSIDGGFGYELLFAVVVWILMFKGIFSIIDKIKEYFTPSQKGLLSMPPTPMPPKPRDLPTTARKPRMPIKGFKSRIKCTHCGANVEYKGYLKCNYCGTKYYSEDFKV